MTSGDSRERGALEHGGGVAEVTKWSVSEVAIEKTNRYALFLLSWVL